VAATVSILISDYSKEVDIIRQLIEISSTDYSTVMHSINVMAFAIGFALYHQLPHSDTKTLGLAALLHDVGKTKIPIDILTAPRELTREEFELMKTHTTIGYRILSHCDFKDETVSIVARDHHERIDGSGYPNNEKDISITAQIIGLIDCYEALTNDDRPYRNAMEIFPTLNQILKQEVMKGIFCPQIYTQFVKSLGTKQNNDSIRYSYNQRLSL
jgi:putative nucleotidyltransferase with HDIG domain